MIRAAALGGGDPEAGEPFGWRSGSGGASVLMGSLPKDGADQVGQEPILPNTRQASATASDRTAISPVWRPA